MDDANNRIEYTDSSSLESDETTVISDPAASEISEKNTEQNYEQDSSFVGYEPPKPHPWQVFLKRRWIPLSLGGIAAVVLAASTAIFIASSRPKDTQIAAAPPANQSAVAAEVVKPDEHIPSKPETMAAKFSFSRDKKMYKLVSDGEIWLERAETEWLEYATAEGWLYYTSNKTQPSPGANNSITKVGIEAFNFKTKAYSALGDLDLPVQSELAVPLRVQNGYLYMSFRDQGDGGVTYRCQVDKEKACGSPELFYDQPGSVHIINDEEAYIVQSSTDAASYSYTVIKLVVSSKQTTVLMEGKMSGGAGDYFVGVSDDGLVWIAQTVADPQNSGGITGVVARLTAWDNAGNQKFVLTPESFPLVEPSVMAGDGTISHEFVLANADEQVVFDINKKEFDPIERRQSTDQDGLSDFHERAEALLKLPSLFSIKEIL